MSNWQLRDAKQRFSELIRSARTEGPQTITRGGEEIAVVLDIKEYQRLRGDQPDFKDFLRSAPYFDEFDIEMPVRKA